MFLIKRAEYLSSSKTVVDVEVDVAVALHGVCSERSYQA